MDAHLRELLKVHFEQALALSLEERSAFLDEVCAADPARRDELDSLLYFYEEAPDFLDSLAGTVLSPLLAQAQPASVANTEAHDYSGQTISHYQVLGKIGQGGMGVVYKAHDTRLDRTVALKFLPPHLSLKAEGKARLIHEAKAASSFDHPNIGSVYDIDETVDGRLFIAMAYYDGETLQDKIGRGPLLVDTVLDYAQQIAEGLARAHEEDIVHRDLKPANVIVTERGEVKLLDFGLAKVKDMRHTWEGTIYGTLPYMSPEQLHNGNVDWRADSWAFGVALYEMLCGTRPFAGDSVSELVHQIRHDEPAALCEDVPDALSELVGDLLRKDPTARLLTMTEVATQLSDIRQTLTNGADVPGTMLLTRTWSRPAMYTLTALLILAISTLAIWSLGLRRDEAPALDSNRYVILPFDVHGNPSLAYLEEGLMDMLYTYLNGVGDLTVVDPQLIRLQGRRISVEEGRAVANRFGAARFILGTVLNVGDSMLLGATLHDETDTPVGTAYVELDGSEPVLLEATEKLAREILRLRYPESTAALERTAIRLSRNTEALRDFLAGQVELRRDMTSPKADSLFLMAVQKDSSFALAWFRLGIARMYPAGSSSGDHMEAFERAYQLGDHLPDRERSLIEGYRAFGVGDANVVERIGKRLIEKNPYDAQAMALLGEGYFHFNAWRGRMITEATPWLRRADQLVPDNDEYRDHLMMLAAEEERWAWIDTMITQDAMVFPPTNCRRGMVDVYRCDREIVRTGYKLLAQLASTEPTVREAALQAFVEDPNFYYIELVIDYLEDFRLAEHMTRLWKDQVENPRDVHTAMLNLMETALLAQGRVREALAVRDPYLAPGERAPGSWNLMVALPLHQISGARLDVLRRRVADGGYFVGWLPRGRLFNMGLVAWYSSDPETLDSLVAELDTYAVEHAEGSAHWLARRVEALAAFSRGQYERVLEIHEAGLWEGWDFNWNGQTGHPLDTYIRAEALYRLGRREEALRWLNGLGDGLSRASVWLLPMAGLVAPSYHRRAIIYDELGQTDEAIDYYTRFVDLWQDADEPLQPMVRDASERIQELLVEKEGEPGSLSGPW